MGNGRAPAVYTGANGWVAGPRVRAELTRAMYGCYESSERGRAVYTRTADSLLPTREKVPKAATPIRVGTLMSSRPKSAPSLADFHTMLISSARILSTRSLNDASLRARATEREERVCERVCVRKQRRRERE